MTADDDRHPYGRRVGASQQARLNALAGVLELGRDTFFAQGDMFGWRPQDGSVGKDEHDAGAGGFRHAVLATHAPAVASVMTRTAAEQLGGLAAIFRAGEVFGAPEPVVRSVLENCAYACWVLDPRTTGKQRGARVLAAELTTVTHLRAAVAEVAGVNGDEYKTLSEGFDQLVAIANELFSPFTPPKSRDSFTVGGERYPSFTQAVNAWADGPGGGRVSGRGLYGALCSDTHPKALAARLSWNTDPQADLIVQGVTFSYLDRLVTAALSPFYSALVCLASYHGWLGNGALSEFETAYEALAPGALM